MFDEASVNAWKEIFTRGLNDVSWKKVAASDGRLKAMSRVIQSGAMQPHEYITAFKNLTPEEQVRLDNYRKENGSCS